MKIVLMVEGGFGIQFIFSVWNALSCVGGVSFKSGSFLVELYWAALKLFPLNKEGLQAAILLMARRVRASLRWIFPKFLVSLSDFLDFVWFWLFRPV